MTRTAKPPQGKWIRWDENGQPHFEYNNPVSAQQMQMTLAGAMALPYDPLRDPDTGEPLSSEQQFIGYTRNEVAAMRRAQLAAEGDLDSQIFMANYIIGKPKQSIEQITVQMSFAQFLEEGGKRMAALEEKQNALPAPPVINVVALTVDDSLWDEV